MRLKFLLVLMVLGIIHISYAQNKDCRDLTSKRCRTFKQNAKLYMADTLEITKVKLNKPSYQPDERYIKFIDENYTDCEKLVGIPVFELKIKQKNTETYWLMMFDIEGSILQVSRYDEGSTVASWHKEYQK